MEALLRNSRLRYEFDILLPLKICNPGPDDPEVPINFPNTVRKFLRMDVDQVIYLLKFYDIPVVKNTDAGNQTEYLNLDSAPNPLVQAEIQANIYFALHEIARYIGLKLHKVKSKRAERMRDAYELYNGNF
ncbi:hypothetical protein ABW20_dc0104289 [Dactylellina cionopaga]|nr:hypothetical protein ABW20_dc0104289 [Dactylellina cionopaga]